MKKTVRVALSVIVVMVFIIGNFNTSFSASKNDLNVYLNDLTNIVDTVKEDGSKKVAKKQLKKAKKIYKKVDKLNINDRVKSIALVNAYEVENLCKQVKKDEKLTQITTLKTNACISNLKSAKTVNKSIKSKSLNDVIRTEAARQLYYQSKSFDKNILNVISSGKEYDTNKMEALFSEITDQTSDIDSCYFRKATTSYDTELINAATSAHGAMLDFRLGKLTVAQYDSKRTAFLNVADKYGNFN
jgi:hypothetical protein